MILEGLKYIQYEDEPREWSILGNNDDYAYFGNINLLVGKNAVGKSRTLNVIKELANLLSGRANLSQMKFSSQKFNLIFRDKNGDNKDTRYSYILEIKDREIIYERLLINDTESFARKKGDGKLILSHLADAGELELLAQSGELGVCSKLKNDKDCYPHFTAWGASLKNYLFSDQFEKRLLIEDIATMEQPEQNVEITGALLLTYYLGKKEFGENFTNSIVKDMKSLGYDEITAIDIHKEKEGYSIGVEENGRYVVSQRQMSQGMFRALSLLIFISYATMKELSACILIDDIGEGVDFDRSKLLSQLLIRKIQNSSIQCFMSTNDRYVMNDIPLRFWTVIDRDIKKSILFDNKNTREIFEDFQFTGLNNYEFLTTNFYKEGFGADSDAEDDDEH